MWRDSPSYVERFASKRERFAFKPTETLLLSEAFTMTHKKHKVAKLKFSKWI